ncbi:MAG: DUF4091 domain-containing protein [Verrucomicrobiae bacterium]|nr:DUF4091 domain-containing protein [Verrucomicrobiae bacterium]
MSSLCLLLLTAPLLFQMGTEKSALWPGFAKITPKSEQWQSKNGLSASVQAYRKLIENKSRGREEPPPIWTNPITEAAILGDSTNSFLINAPPGDYNLYVVCGTSDLRHRAQYFDFTVQVGQQSQRVQIEGCHQFRTLRFRARVAAVPLAVRFAPRSKWVVNAVMVWNDTDAARVEKEIIAPFEEWTFRLPPEEWAKWKQDPEPPTGPMPKLSVADEKRGFLVWTRHYLECVYPRTNPREEDLNPELRAFATPGEDEPLNFVVRPLRELTNCKVTVSNIGPVPAQNVEVRRVRYMLARPNYTTMYRYRVVPDVLERFSGGNLKADENARFWLTVRVPDNAPAGEYRGSITFSCDSGKTVVPVRLRILPFKLRDDPTKIFGIYYHHPLDRAAEAKDEASREYFRRKAELEHADMVAHGTRNIVLSLWAQPADKDGRFDFKWDTLAAKLQLWEKYGFHGPIVMAINTGGIYRKYMRESYGSHLRGVKDPPEEFCRELTAMVQAIEAGRKQRGWPEFLYYPVDEPGTEPASVNFMVKVLKACKAAGVRTYVTADPTHEAFAPMRPYVDVWCTQPFAPDRDTVLADSKARGVEYWCYPNHVNGENDHTPVAGARMTYGFGFWRSGFRTLIPWIYQHNSGDPWNYLDGPTMDFFNRSEPDGTPIPVALWEAYREGYDDYRYLYTLEQLIAEARKLGKPVAEAEKELKFVWESIRVQTKYKYDNLWSPAEFDVYRWIIARQILALLEH